MYLNNSFLVKSTYKSLLNNLVLGICEQFQELSDLWIEDNIKPLQIMEGNHHSSQVANAIQVV